MSLAGSLLPATLVPSFLNCSPDRAALNRLITSTGLPTPKPQESAFSIRRGASLGEVPRGHASGCSSREDSCRLERSVLSEERSVPLRAV